MSDFSQGPGWWQASDGKWYPPEQAPGAQPTAPPPGAPGAYGAPAPGYGAPPAYGAPGAAPQGQLAEWPERALSGLIDYFASNEPLLLALCANNVLAPETFMRVWAKLNPAG